MQLPMHHPAMQAALANAGSPESLRVAQRYHLRTNPEGINILAERELVKLGGLRSFIKLAWHTVEGGTPYSSNWHIDAICEHLEAVSARQIKRLIIAVPPRSMKSVSTAVMWPAWDWVNNPSRRFLFSSYAHNLSKRDSARCRRVIVSPWYQQRWGERFKLTSDQNAKHRFENDKTGYRMATSVGGQLTGDGGDVVVIDDPINASDAESGLKRERTLTWWNESMSTRLNDPANGAFVIIQQRLHEQDVVGDVIKRHGLVQDDGDYVYLCLPAEFDPDHPHRWFRDPRKETGELLWPSHVPRKIIDGLKAALGPYAAAGQLQQLPAPREGGLFKRSWFKIERVLPADLSWARGWDLAATEAQTVKSDPDYTATVLIGWSRSQKRWYIADVERWREDPAAIERIIKAKAEQDVALGRQFVKIELPQDPGQAGKSQAQAMIRMLAGHDVRAVPQSGDKVVRSTPFASQAAGGHISVLDAEWTDDYLRELTGFPTGGHDDMVDATASAFNRLTGGTTGLIEYYARMIDDINKDKAAASGELERNGGVPPALIVKEEVTTNMAWAFVPKPSTP